MERQSPPDTNRGAEHGAGSRGEALDASIPTAGDLPAQLRAGNVRRVNLARDVDCRCLDCPADFTTTGAAASHARSARHTVEVDYRVAFAFEPAERRGGAR